MSSKCVFSVDDRLFCPAAILKASYLFIDRYYVSTSYSGEHTISISLEPKVLAESNNVEKEFSNELIAQMVRYNLSISNKTLKELVIGRALYSTYIDFNEPDIIQQNELDHVYSLDDIAVNWFDVNEI